MLFKHRTRIVLLLAVIGLLVSQGVLYAQQSPSAEAQAAQSVQIFLPLLSEPGTSPTDPQPDAYTQLRTRAGEACPQLAPNQLCYVGGPVRVQTAAGTQEVTTVGTTLDLATVERLTLLAPSADSRTWGLVRLRLRAGGDLDLLAFGSVDLRFVTLAATNQDVPELQLRTTATPASAFRYTSGLMATSAVDTLNNLTINSATLSLVGAAYLSAYPTPAPADSGDELLVPLVVAVAEGVAHVASAGSDQVLVQGQQVEVAPAASGEGNSPPSPPIEVVLKDFLFNLIVPLDATTRQQLADTIIARFETAISRCVSGRAGSIYNVIFWSRTISGVSYLAGAIDTQRLTAAQAGVPNCLSFEIEFNSGTTTTGGPVTESSTLQASRMPVRFNADGSMRLGGEADLSYLSHTYTSPAPCAMTKITLDGKLRVEAASLRLSVNQLRIGLRVGVIGQPMSEVIMNCPLAPPITISEDQWWVAFPQLHRDIWQPGEIHNFSFNDWRYTAGSSACDGVPTANCEHVAETIYQHEESDGGITFTADTHLILVHAPIR